MSAQLGKPAVEIGVSHYRSILLWPLRLRLPAAADAERRLGRTVDSICARLNRDCRWTEITDLFDHLPPLTNEAPDASYGEFVYFHPFVRRFLYGAAGQRRRGEAPPIRIFRRLDIHGVEVTLSNEITGRFTIILNVDRVHLYVLGAGALVLAVEVSALGRGAAVRSERDGERVPLTLAHALAIQERFRRTYPTFWSDSLPGLFPEAVAWLTTAGEVATPAPAAAPSSAFARKVRDAPVAGHWLELLRPLTGADDPWGGALLVQHVVDERIPVMTYLAVDDPAAIGDGDWARIALVDEPDPSPYPYAEAFLEGFEKAHCYDRFWEPPLKKTRYLFSGYGFAVVGAAGDEFFSNVIWSHFRRHYFQMGLISHLQLATLLILSDRLSQAVAAHDGAGQELDLEATIRSVLRDLLDFDQRYWFPDISNQIQAREMFELWRSHLGVEELHRHVKDKAGDAHQFLTTESERRTADAGFRLNVIATIGLVFALTTGFLGMNIVVGAGNWDSRPQWSAFGLTLGGFTGLAGALIAAYDALGVKRRHRYNWLHIGLGIVVAGVVVSVLSLLFLFGGPR